MTPDKFDRALGELFVAVSKLVSAYRENLELDDYVRDVVSVWERHPKEDNYGNKPN